MVCMCIPCTFELEAGESGGQGQAHSVIQFKVSLGSVSLVLKKRGEKIHCF